MIVRRLALAGLALAASCGPRPERAVAPAGKYLRSAEPIAGSYLVVLREGARTGEDVAAVAREKAERHHGTVTYVYGSALRGFAARLDAKEAIALAADPDVDFVEEDGVVRASTVQPYAPWGLDRIDQRTGLDGAYRYALTGVGVHAYVIDTGIRTTHEEFEGRATADFTVYRGDDRDCNGHGTHVAGTVGGKTYGVAKQVRLHAVRVLNCWGEGSDSDVIAGIDWMTAHHERPAVANMSLGGSAAVALDLAVQRSIAAGVTYAIAAGNDAGDACADSPARVPQAITVGALARPFGSTQPDRVAYFSNVGPCVDVYAPGEQITSAYNGWDSDWKVASGTSMASPHVAGAAALYLEANPAASPAEVAHALAASASTGIIAYPPEQADDPVLYAGFLQPASGEPPAAALTAPSDGDEVSGTVSLAATADVARGVAEVAFFADGRLVAADREAPYAAAWDTMDEDTGPHVLEVGAYDDAWIASPRASIRVIVRNRGRSAPDPDLGAPSCRSVEARCFTGRSVAGRAGTEWAGPNTIHGTCPDGAYGAWLSESSVERIEVRTADGTPFAPGREVVVRADWRASSPRDAVDLFSAADAAAPAWEHRGRVDAGATGPRATEWRFALPAGSWQALRVAYRSELRTDASSTSAAPCTLDFFDDRDDLAFAIGDGVADASAPAVAVTGPAAAAVGARATLQASATDDRGVRRVAFEVEGALVGDALAAPFQAGWTPLAPGAYRVVARAWDASGNEGVSAPFVVDVGDRTPPAIAWVVPFEWSSSLEYATSAPFAVSTEDLGGGVVQRVELLVDGAVAATVNAPPWQGSWDTTAFAEGLHAIVARAVDDSGNAGATRPITVRIDRTPPAAAIATPAEGSVVSGAVPLQVLALDAGHIASVTWSADGVTFGSGASTTWDSRTAAQGPHVLRAVVADTAGNRGEASVTVRVQDLVAPTVTVWASPIQGDVTSGRPQLYASATDDVAVVRTELYLDGTLVAASPYSSASTTWDATGAEGRHELFARAVDAAGNVGTLARTIEVDATPPAVTVLSPAAGETLEAPLTVAVATIDAHAIAGSQLFLDGRLVASRNAPPFDLPLDPRFVPSGPHVLAVRAWDVAGNAAVSADVPVEVLAPEAAAYDPALGAPRCASVGAACRAGFLVAGTGPAELHWPNTLGGAADDPLLTFGAIDAIEVATLDGTPLAAGKTVRVRVLLHGGDSVYGKIFAAHDALLPVWRFLDYVGSSRWDAAWYETTFVLPPGPVQALRVANGVETAQDPASTYNSDYDDLVFAVAP